MQYGIKGEDLTRSRIEILEDLSRESVESLDSLLPQFHCDNIQQLEIERRVVVYLRSLGLKFKTDPRQKEQDYFDYPKKNAIIFQQMIGESPLINNISILKLGTGQSNKRSDSEIILSPFLLGKQRSFEI
ncbi:unnamed protein product [Paramecium sonneborni]|uniref:Uncharacterized protein n=1 Tax=Paramecium sonneborni TaxID=65129 RepID=A0A8S1P8R6_9CILI|nr:unnamed protein product [Paramecium sonneborni]